MKEQNLSLRKLAEEIGVSHSYLSEALNGKKTVSRELGNRLADFFNVQRTVIYNLLGWLDLDSDDILVERFREYSRQNPDFAEFVKLVLDIESAEERRRLIRLVRAGLDK